MDKYKILICCHKETPRIRNELFSPILLGSAYADTALRNAFKDDFWDNMGDNIADLHPYCAELSAIYWAWKNYDKLGNPDYIGLFHYRRFLNFREPVGEPDLWKCAFFDFDDTTCERFGWTEEDIRQFCSGCDLVLPAQEDILDPKDWKTPASLETHYKHSHYPEDFDTAINFIKKNDPQYKESVERVRQSKTGHFCNMFLMTRELFFDYAQWLFGILLPLKDILPIEGKKYRGVHAAQRRVLGFLGERLFNVWIDYQEHQGGAKIRETERLTGYLSEEDQRQFLQTYGPDAYKKAVSQSKRGTGPAEGRAEGDGLIVHDSRWGGTPDVSVLLPVYNVGAYLRPCIESLINQTLLNIELVFVYDKSQDNSLDILMEYYRCDPRITVIENMQRGGLSRARNIGMQFARGKYFAFVDSDDICDVTMFEKLYNKAEQLAADIVTCSVWGFYDTVENKYLHRQLEWFGDSDRVLGINQRPQQLMEPAAWCKLFRAEYIQSLDYFAFRADTVSWEDVPAMTSAFVQTDRIATVQEPLYYYRQRTSGNLSNCMTRRYVDEFISGAQMQAQILEKYGPFDWEFMSYVEEFKCLFAEWMLSKLARRDVPYFFHHAACLFRLKDRKYLTRLFTLYPKRRLFYYVLLSRSCLLYYIGKGVFRAGRKIKYTIKRIFGIRREGVYRAFQVGPLHFKKHCKAYSNQTIAWLEARVQNAEAWGREQHVQNAALQQSNANWQAENQRLDALGQELQKENRELVGINAQLQSDIDALSGANAQLRSDNDALNGVNARLRSDIDALNGVNARLRSDIDALNGVNAQLQSDNDALSKTILDLQAESQTLGGAVEELRATNEAREAEITTLQSQRVELNKTIEDYRTEFAGFYHAVWTTGWVDIWKQYHLEHYGSIPEKKAALKETLDAESVELIDRICYRNFQLLPMQADSNLFRYDHQHIYTPAELAGAAEPLDEDFYRHKYVIPEDMYLEVPVFRFHCGIPFFPEKAVQQIAGRDVIDGGAFWGDSALILHDYQPRKIYAFEPQPDNYARLKKTITDNRMENDVTAVPYGLGDKNEVRQLYTSDMMSGANIMHVKPNLYDGKEIVSYIDVVSIDTYVQDHSLDVGLIKLDIEGNELAAIHGAEQTIRKYRPLLCISIYHCPQDFFEVKPFIERLGLGYRFMIRKLAFHDLVTEIVLLGYPDGEGKE